MARNIFYISFYTVQSGVTTLCFILRTRSIYAQNINAFCINVIHGDWWKSHSVYFQRVFAVCVYYTRLSGLHASNSYSFTGHKRTRIYVATKAFTN